MCWSGFLVSLPEIYDWREFKERHKVNRRSIRIPRTKKNKIMATLKDLCSSVPQSLLREQAIYNVNQRKQAAYNKRMHQLDMERAIFEQCKRQRTQKRVRNSFSTEEAGRYGGGTIIATIRNNGTHIHQVCRVSANRY